MRKWSLAAAWVVVAGLATTLTWQIVSAADEQVSDRPVAPLQVGAPLVNASSTTLGGGTTSTSPPATSVTPTTTPQTSTSDTVGTPPSTVAEQDWSSRTISTSGGVVVVSYRPGEVVLSSAVPAPGFAAEVNTSGPPDVDVEFESESAKYRVRAKWDGELAVETESDSEDD